MAQRKPHGWADHSSVWSTPVSSSSPFRYRFWEVPEANDGAPRGWKARETTECLAFALERRFFS